MKFFAIILLATLSYTQEPSKTENLYSYQLQFQSYEQCLKFYNDFEAKLLNGLLDHGTTKYGKIQIDYVSCAEVEISTGSDKPKVLCQVPVYERL